MFFPFDVMDGSCSIFLEAQNNKTTIFVHFYSLFVNFLSTVSSLLVCVPGSAPALCLIYIFLSIFSSFFLFLDCLVSLNSPHLGSLHLVSWHILTKLNIHIVPFSVHIPYSFFLLFLVCLYLVLALYISLTTSSTFSVSVYLFLYLFLTISIFLSLIDH